MSDSGTRRAKLLRTILGTLSGTAYVAGQSAGYDYGTPTTLGIDAGLLRDIITAALAMAATFWPQVSKVGVIFKSLSNDPRVETMEAKLTVIETRVAKLESTAKP
jgi:hypothetical protein